MEILNCVPQVQVPGLSTQGEALHRMYEKVYLGYPQAVREEDPEGGQKMTYIYKPKGRALEYSPLALNIYTGCDHGCTYCYNRFRFPIDDPRLRNINMVSFREELAKENYDEQVLLSFVGDPYCHAEMKLEATKMVLVHLLNYNVKVAILTKGGCRALRDLKLFKSFGLRIKVGATLTFLDDDKAKDFEPNSAPPSERIAMLKTLSEHNIRTFVSIEPVLDPNESLAVMKKVIPWVDEFRVGKLNHDHAREAQIDWPDFARKAKSLLMQVDSHKIIYFKRDLRETMGDLEIPAHWTDMKMGCL